MNPGIPGRATVTLSSDIARLYPNNDVQESTGAMPVDAEPSALLSNGHPKYARTCTLLDKLLLERAPSLPVTPRLPKRSQYRWEQAAIC
jgi:hypothetical protein